MAVFQHLASLHFAPGIASLVEGQLFLVHAPCRGQPQGLRDSLVGLGVCELQLLRWMHI